MATACPSCGIQLPESTDVCAACGYARQPLPSEAVPADVSLATAPVLGTPAFATDSDLKGIGGWLIVHAVGLGIAPLVSLVAVFTDLRILNAASYQAGLHARPGLAILILFEASTNVIMFLGLIGLNILFYRTRRSFRRWIIAFLIAAFVVTLCDHLWTMHFLPSTTWTAVAQRLVAALIWVPYFLQSRRVKQTFVN
jgi:FtsH-binding integral membrane protein